MAADLRTADAERKVATRDVPVGGQDLPAQTVGAGAEPGSSRRNRVWRALVSNLERSRPAVGERQRETRAAAVNPDVEAQLYRYVWSGDGRVGCRRRLDEHSVRDGNAAGADQKRQSKCDCQEQIWESTNLHISLRYSSSTAML